MADGAFWNSQKEAQKVISESNLLKQVTNPLIEFHKEIEDVQCIIEILDDDDDENIEEEESIITSVSKMLKDLDNLEIKSFLGGKTDNCPAILSINSGAGGTESCDWADMLLRTYTRWAERRGFKSEILEFQGGEETGVSSVTIRITGEYAFGYAKAERGVHRLVRISPFDSNKKRHTSFCSVDVIAEVQDDIDIVVKDEDIRVDTFRSSGKGGQHVNKTDSAVRITHFPTGIVISCQNERSQIKNRAMAMKMLKSSINERLEDEKRVAQEKFYSEKGEIGWGNQIRSYVFQPYQMVKDLRTGSETSNVQAVMDGDIDKFIHAWLRAGCPTKRNNAFSDEE
tara:strand:+ start:366 stop:1388 length:1023 start_codon:yes stop_codon:yes gene_type:complete